VLGIASERRPLGFGEFIARLRIFREVARRELVGLVRLDRSGVLARRSPVD